VHLTVRATERMKIQIQISQKQKQELTV
jgi:hypothetical protein